MNSLSETMTAAASGMRAQSLRLRLAAENIANADTPGYRRKTVDFRAVHDGQDGAAVGVRTGSVRLDPTPPERRYQPGHPLADAQGYVAGSNVNLVIEIADSREAQRSWEANLRLFDQARQMAQGALELLRR